MSEASSEKDDLDEDEQAQDLVSSQMSEPEPNKEDKEDKNQTKSQEIAEGEQLIVICIDQTVLSAAFSSMIMKQIQQEMNLITRFPFLH